MSTLRKLTNSEAGKLGYIKSKETHKKNNALKQEKYILNATRCTTCSTPLVYKKRTNKFCNKTCAARYNNANRDVVAKVRKPCAYCASKTTTAKYCSLTCQANHRYAIQKKEVERTGTLKWVAAAGFPKRYLLETRGHRCEICKLENWMGKK